MPLLFKALLWAAFIVAVVLLGTAYQVRVGKIKGRRAMALSSGARLCLAGATSTLLWFPPQAGVTARIGVSVALLVSWVALDLLTPAAPAKRQSVSPQAGTVSEHKPV